MNGKVYVPERKSIRELWEKGLCPCCGHVLDEEWGDGPSKTIAEGVKLCGSCIKHGHDEEDILPIILRALVEP